MRRTASLDVDITRRRRHRPSTAAGLRRRSHICRSPLERSIVWP